MPSETLIAMIVREVLAELARRGVVVQPPGSGNGHAAPSADGGLTARPNGSGAARPCPRTLEIDFTDYKTPVLTEHHVRAAGRDVKEIIVPAGTVCTIGARDLLQQRHLTLTTNGKKH